MNRKRWPCIAARYRASAPAILPSHRIGTTHQQFPVRPAASCYTRHTGRLIAESSRPTSRNIGLRQSASAPSTDSAGGAAHCMLNRVFRSLMVSLLEAACLLPASTPRAMFSFFCCSSTIRSSRVSLQTNLPPKGTAASLGGQRKLLTFPTCDVI